MKDQSWTIVCGMWYSESHDDDNYSHLITMITSHCVVHNYFMASRVQWQLVEFRV